MPSRHEDLVELEFSGVYLPVLTYVEESEDEVPVLHVQGESPKGIKDQGAGRLRPHLDEVYEVFVDA